MADEVTRPAYDVEGHSGTVGPSDVEAQRHGRPLGR